MTERRLAAILSAKVCGYSRLMGDEDDATVATLDECRRVFIASVGAYSGRIVDMAGDRVLSEFSSAVSAVEAGTRIQAELERRNAELPSVRRTYFRVGINVGDIIGKSDGTICGDGVNIAARVESLAPPGGVGVSGVVYEQVDDEFEHIEFEYIGEHAVENINRPVNVYLAHWRAPATSTVHQLKQGLAPSAQVHRDVAVLSCSIRGFSARCCEGEPQPILSELRTLIESFEHSLDAHDMLYVAGAGTWLAATGLNDSSDTVLRTVLCALTMIKAVRCFHPRWSIQIGIDFGDVCAGTAGRKRCAFDLWGTAIDVARAAMRRARPNTVTVTGRGWHQIASDFHGRPRGRVDVPAVGSVELVECAATVADYH